MIPELTFAYQIQSLHATQNLFMQGYIRALGLA